MMRKGVLPLKNSVRAREISELDEYLGRQLVRDRLGGACLREVGWRVGCDPTHSEMAVYLIASDLRRYAVRRTKSKYDGTTMSVFCRETAERRSAGIVCGD
jgi:hypothetical protein